MRGDTLWSASSEGSFFVFAFLLMYEDLTRREKKVFLFCFLFICLFLLLLIHTFHLYFAICASQVFFLSTLLCVSLLFGWLILHALHLNISSLIHTIQHVQMLVQTLSCIKVIRIFIYIKNCSRTIGKKNKQTYASYFWFLNQLSCFINTSSPFKRFLCSFYTILHFFLPFANNSIFYSCLCFLYVLILKVKKKEKKNFSKERIIAY